MSCNGRSLPKRRRRPQNTRSNNSSSLAKARSNAASVRCQNRSRCVCGVGDVCATDSRSRRVAPVLWSAGPNIDALVYSVRRRVAILPLGRRTLLIGSGMAAAGTAAGLWFWPSPAEQAAAYPFAHRVGGSIDPLWSLSPEKLLSATEDDAKRLERLLPQLERAVRQLETLEPRLANAKTGELSGEERE